MYAIIDDRDVGEVHDTVRVIIGEGATEVSVYVSRLSVTIQRVDGDDCEYQVQRIELPNPENECADCRKHVDSCVCSDRDAAPAATPGFHAKCKACDERRAAGMGPCAMCGGDVPGTGDEP